MGNRRAQEAIAVAGIPSKAGPGSIKAIDQIERFWLMPYRERRAFMVDLQLIPRDYIPRNERDTYQSAFLRAARVPGKIEEIQGLLEQRAPKL